MPLKPPSKTIPTAVPVFALEWYSSPIINPKHILTFAGGGGSAKTGIGNSVQIIIDSKKEIKIDTGNEIAVAIDIISKNDESAYVAVGVGDHIKIYFIRINEKENIDDELDEALLVASLGFTKGSGVNCLSLNITGELIAAGCEDGKVRIASLSYVDLDKIDMSLFSEFEGHIKAVCSCSFHPIKPGVLISSAKDGTCRVWNLNLKGDKCMKVLECKIFDPKGPKPKPNIENPKPGQLLVRGCRFGDLEGRIIYTIQSGRKGGAFLSVWKLLKRIIQGEMDISNNDPSSPPQPKVVFEFQEVHRQQVSQYPVSAMSLSGDLSTIVLGDTNGCITLLSTANERFKRIKYWECAHDLPVTAIAARPLPLPLNGEEATGIKFDAISASADNKLCLVTKQRKSTLRKIKNRSSIKRARGGLIGYFIHFILFCATLFTMKVSYDVCHEEFTGLNDIDELKQCLLHTVLWASDNRPGVSFIPH